MQTPSGPRQPIPLHAPHYCWLREGRGPRPWGLGRLGLGEALLLRLEAWPDPLCASAGQRKGCLCTRVGVAPWDAAVPLTAVQAAWPLLPRPGLSYEGTKKICKLWGRLGAGGRQATQVSDLRQKAALPAPARRGRQPHTYCTARHLAFGTCGLKSCLYLGLPELPAR